MFDFLVMRFFEYFQNLSFFRSTCRLTIPLVSFVAVNIPLRDYQLSITRTALFANTLVALPTGLGKTLIAAVVMYNFFRWFPEGIVIM